ncbi:4Fe-4S binding protein [Ferroglobus sp.]|uniref:4Fe-4S binding protein n=1 Tax=Ferroglobus sp. TaxID=2614230 RepID=UPI0025C37A56|nr:4Fe-4S binding protein [Ferroglobus sp.]
MGVKIKLRRVVQLSFFLFSIYTWWRFYFFVKHFDEGTEFVPRPVSIEAYLPIGGLVSIKNTLLNGYIDPIHPAAMVILSAIIVSAIFLKRGFCGWVCPVGTLSEAVSFVGEKILPRIRIPEFVKVIKYSLMAFFLLTVLMMDRYEVAAFLQTPYWAIADVKLLDFWLNPGTLTIVVTSLIVLLTLFTRNLWCRYLCPYGAFLAIFSFLSAFKIRKTNCINCKACDNVCPAGIKISEKKEVNSTECIACYDCIEVCKTKGLYMDFLDKRVRKEVYVAVLLAILFGFVIVAKVTGNWDSALTYEDYKRLMKIREFITH